MGVLIVRAQSKYSYVIASTNFPMVYNEITFINNESILPI